jgi:hypothetical protein
MTWDIRHAECVNHAHFHLQRHPSKTAEEQSPFCIFWAQAFGFVTARVWCMKGLTRANYLTACACWHRLSIITSVWHRLHHHHYTRSRHHYYFFLPCTRAHCLTHIGVVRLSPHIKNAMQERWRNSIIREPDADTACVLLFIIPLRTWPQTLLIFNNCGRWRQK